MFGCVYDFRFHLFFLRVVLFPLFMFVVVICIMVLLGTRTQSCFGRQTCLQRCCLIVVYFNALLFDVSFISASFKQYTYYAKHVHILLSCCAHGNPPRFAIPSHPAAAALGAYIYIYIYIMCMYIYIYIYVYVYVYIHIHIYT